MAPALAVSSLAVSSISPLASTYAGSAYAAQPGAQGGSSRATTTATEDPQAAAELQQLKATDQKVRAHEAAHLGAAGGLANGGASYTYTRGSDRRLYATGGEVSIDLSPGHTPEETASRARQIERAALAPADPSAQDYRVAARARAMAAEAELEAARTGKDTSAPEAAAPGAEAATETTPAKDAAGRYELVSRVTEAGTAQASSLIATA
ncbi:putative metalloprotease CJM1_0395 family protein [Niveibacterium sp. SC-1]|uniref:putative metalloprotease CJM1_0395 family protein n=1 Tax=Niveibacterium sp. SC-1 TaxID=3135646 RepID=UPI00311E78B1